MGTITKGSVKIVGTNKKVSDNKSLGKGLKPISNRDNKKKVQISPNKSIQNSIA